MQERVASAEADPTAGWLRLGKPRHKEAPGGEDILQLTLRNLFEKCLDPPT